MKLIVRHQTYYRYESGGSRVAMLLRLKPSQFDGQRVTEWHLSVNDEPVERFVRNGHGEEEALWVRHDRLDTATITASGVVETEDRAGVVSGLKFQAHPKVYLRSTSLTRASDEMRALAEGIETETMLACMHQLSQAVRDKVSYRTGSTTSATGAEQAYAQGAGVCQDHAQIFIAMARHLGVPARYVSGYLLANEEQGALYETHAWAEAWINDLGWVGFDISNGLCVTDHYIRLASGLDAYDAAPVRGTALGAGPITVDADVRVDTVGEDHDEARIMELQQQQQ